MKDKYNLEKKKIDIACVPPLDWPWHERLNCLFVGTTKIVRIPQGVD